MLLSSIKRKGREGHTEYYHEERPKEEVAGGTTAALLFVRALDLPFLLPV